MQNENLTKASASNNSGLKSYIKSFGTSGIIGLGATLLIILVAEFLFFTGNEMKAIFVGLWAPTFLGFLNFFKLHNTNGKQH